ncbi:MAG: helix-turn-helix domain-containing protein [Gemmataceae bacterium]|nr:helix-turn-helix domain-containing protein [Gemmataceae bacterium]
MDDDALALKIRRLVEERGWNQEDFAKFTRLNRHTVRQILLPGQQRRLRNATVGACARALGLTVSELREQGLERLLPRMVSGAASGEETLRRRYEEATHPDLKAWIERNGERARQMSDDELAEVLALQAVPAGFSPEAAVARLERRRRVVAQVRAIAATEYLDLLEQVVSLLHDKVRPPGKE